MVDLVSFAWKALSFRYFDIAFVNVCVFATVSSSSKESHKNNNHEEVEVGKQHMDEVGMAIRTREEVSKD